MDQHEILLRIEQQAKSQTRLARVQCIFSVLSFLCIAGVLVVVLNFIPQMEGLVSEAQNAIGELTTVAEQIQGLDFSNLNEGMNSLLKNVNGLIGEANTLLTESGGTLRDTMDRVNAIDFDALNKAISDLSKVIEPLANFIGRFK